MAELNLDMHVHTIALADDEYENGRAAISYILEQQWPVTAILAASDELAYGARGIAAASAGRPKRRQPHRL